MFIKSVQRYLTAVINKDSLPFHEGTIVPVYFGFITKVKYISHIKYQGSQTSDVAFIFNALLTTHIL